MINIDKDTHRNLNSRREAAKKGCFFSNDRAIKEGEGKGPAIKEKFCLKNSKAIKLEV